MKIESLAIDNFRGIRSVRLSNLDSMVIVAGQNGSGKSCIFDAIRLFKSVYGGYQQNEWQQWMGEFQIDLNRKASTFASMFNDPAKQLSVTCEFVLAESEQDFVKTNAKELLREAIWKSLVPDSGRYGGGGLNAQFRAMEPEVTTRLNKALPSLMREIESKSIKASFRILPGQTPETTDAPLLELIFSNYRPQDMGVIDYHGAQRHYGRELVQGINLNLDAHEQQRSHSALYNYANKYNNVKSEMAATFIKEMLAERAGVAGASQATLTKTLQSLFETFFPDKQFLGPQATVDGRLSFPVKLSSGSEHDLDELSAGEKEILYGYLRIRNSAPKNSVILLDEPELHLNPRLIRALPEFYRKNLGRSLNNQIWLVTHSDALLREVVGRSGYDVYHMLPCASVTPGDTQLRRLEASGDLESALVDLVGDLASYHPAGRVVIFEGGGDSDFDQRMTALLFPELARSANLVSGSNKARVRALHDVLREAARKARLPFTFFAITDRDSDEVARSEAMNVFCWDAYHIENYLLSVPHIRLAMLALNMGTAPSENEIVELLKKCAMECLPELVRNELAGIANRLLIESISTRTNPNEVSLAESIGRAVSNSEERIKVLKATRLSANELAKLEADIRRKYLDSLSDETWRQRVPGRSILKRFAGKTTSVSYEAFRNLVLSQMVDTGFKPTGMELVVSKVLQHPLTLAGQHR